MPNVSIPTAEPARITKLSLLAPAFCVRGVEAYRKMKAAGLPVVIFETFRTNARATWLWAQGRERPGDIVTNARSAAETWHGWGMGIDFAFVTAAGQVFWPPEGDQRWDQVGAIIESVGLKWGGHFSSIHDMPHCQPNNAENSPPLAVRWTYGQASAKLNCWMKYDMLSIEYYDQHGLL